MKLEQQVVSLELSKRLKELGVVQESLFGWQKEGNVYKLHYFGDTKSYKDYPAYTVAELGEMLKIGGYDEGISVAYTDIHFRSFRSGKSTLEHQEYICNLSNWGKKTKLESGDDIPEEITFTEPKEADARARMLIYLLENKLIK